MDQELNIIVNAVNDAAPALEEVTTQLDEVGISAQGLATTFDESVAELNAAMDMVDAGAATMATEFDTAVADMEAAAATAATSVEESALAQDEAMTTSMSSLKSTALQAGIVAVIAFQAIKGEIQSASDASTKWNETILELNRELTNTGSSIPVSELVAYGAELSKNTLYSQQDILSAEAEMMSYTNLQGQYKQVTQAAADLAAKTGDDLPTAMGILTKALADPLTGVRQLQSAHINLSATTVKTINDLAQGGATAAADAVLMAALKDQIGGLSEAMSDAAGTGMTKLGNELNNLQIIIGEALAPVLDQIAKDLEPIIKSIAAWVEAHPKLTAAILIGTAALAGLVVVLVGIGLVIATVGASFTAITDLMVGLAAGGALPLLIAAVAALGAGFVFLYTQAGSAWNGIKDVIGSVIDYLTKLFEDWYKKVTGWITDIVNAMSSIGKAIGGGIGGAVGGVENFIGGAIKAFASGGIVSSPTLAMVGEAGPEAIIPLSAFSGGDSLAGSSLGGGGNNAINVYITGTVMSTEAQAKTLGDQIARQINRSIRLQTYR